MSQSGRCRPASVSDGKRRGNRRRAVALAGSQARAPDRGRAGRVPVEPAREHLRPHRKQPLEVAYPDDDAPGVLLKLGKAVEGGAGPDGDIVGFTTICPHKGFPLNYVAEDRTFNCPGHYSRFDPEAGGQQIWGQATQNLPQYVLRVDEAGDIYAEGVDELLYGRLSNVL